MKVLFVSTLGSEFKGGGNISSSLMAESLCKSGMEVVMEYVRKNDGYTFLDGVLKYTPEGFYNTNFPLLDFLIGLRIKAYVREHLPDIVDVQDRYSVIPVSRCRLGGAKKAFTVIDDLSREQLESSHDSVKLFLMNRKRKAVLKRLKKESHIITNSRYTKETLVKLGVPADRATPIYRSLPPREWYTETVRDATRSHPDGAEKRTTFLMPGRIAREKGVLEVIAILEELEKEGHGGLLEVVMVGRGPLAELVRKKEEGGLVGLRLLGPVNIRDMLELYRQADAVLQPLINRESFGRVVLEALLLAKPLIVNPRGGVNEIVEGMEKGCIFVGDRGQTKEAMLRLALHPEEIGKMSSFLIENGDRIRERFDPGKPCVEYRSLYEKMLREESAVKT